MIAFLIYVVVLWLVWRWLCRSTHVVAVEPPPPAVTVLTPSITVHVHISRG